MHQIPTQKCEHRQDSRTGLCIVATLYSTITFSIVRSGAGNVFFEKYHGMPKFSKLATHTKYLQLYLVLHTAIDHS